MTTIFADGLIERAHALVAACRDHGIRVATAESCTGGLLAGLLTEVAGASSVVEGGFVSYSNDAKSLLLGVPPSLLAEYGAVSEPVSRAMAEGARARLETDLAVGITGIAGPGGGTSTKPVGLVHLAMAVRGAETRHVERRYGELGRPEIRERAVADALGLLEAALRQRST